MTQVFASLPKGGWVKVLDENVEELSFARVKGKPAMILVSALTDHAGHALRPFALDVDHRHIAADARQESRRAFAHSLTAADHHGFLAGQSEQGCFCCHRSIAHSETPPSIVTSAPVI